MRVFISFSGDVDAARDVADLLATRGFDVFSAHQLQPGATWEREVHQALRRADVLLVICSERSLQRSWVGFEVGFSVARGVPIVPLTLDIEASTLPTPFSANQALSIRGPRVTWERLLLGALDALHGTGEHVAVEIHSRDSYDAARGTIEDRLARVRNSLSVSANDGALVIGSLSSKLAALLDAGVSVAIMCVDPRAARAVQGGVPCAV
jgi:hypothetical protein